jgi:hypothetical protein
MAVQVSLGKKRDPISLITRVSSGRAPCQQLQGTEFKSQYSQKRKENTYIFKIPKQADIPFCPASLYLNGHTFSYLPFLLKDIDHGWLIDICSEF